MADQAWPRIRLKFVTSQRRVAPHNVEEYVGLEHVDSWTGKLLDTVPSQAMTGDGIAAEPGDVLFGKLRPYLAKGWKADRPISCSSEFAVLRPKSRLDADFLRYVLLDKEFVDAMTTLTYGTKMPRVSPDEIANYAIATPDLPTQRAIAAFLDRETAKINALIEKKHRLLDLLDEKRTALITRAVTRGLDPDVPMKDSGVEWLGEIPAQWKVAKLGRLLRQRPSYGVLKPQRYQGMDGVPLLRISDIDQGSPDLEGAIRIPPEQSQEYNRTLVQEDDIVVSVVGTIGAVFVVPRECAGANLSRALARVQVGPRLTSSFLRIFIESQCFTRYVDLVSQGTAQRVLNMGDLAGLYMPLPPPSEQSEVALMVQAATRRVGHLNEEVKDAISLLREYRTALISAAVSGQVDVESIAA